MLIDLFYSYLNIKNVNNFVNFVRYSKRQTLDRVFLNQFFLKIAGVCNFTNRLRILKRKIKKKYVNKIF